MTGLVAYGAAAGPAVLPASAQQTPTAPAVAVPQNETKFAFDLKGGMLAETLAGFEGVTGIRVTLVKADFGLLSSPGLQGQYTPDQALERILAGTGIAFRYTAPNMVSLDLKGLSTTVEVSTTVPGTVLSSAKYTESLREIPQTIEVIPREVLQEQGAVTLSDALRNVPGITLQAGEGGGASNTTGDMFNLRGFSASNSIFVDGVRDDGLMSRNIFNVEQVEVYLGPTGSDVGRGTASGYVNLQTKSPHVTPTYSGVVSYDDSNQKRGSIDLNQPIRLGAQNSWFARAAARLNAMWQEGGVPGRDVVKLRNRAIAPSISLGLGTPTRVTVSSQITRQNNVPDYGIPTAAWAPEALGPATIRATSPVNQANYYGSIGYDYDRIYQSNYTARVEHELNENFTIRYQTRFNQTRRDAIITGLGAFSPATQTVALTRQGNERRNRIVTNQANVNAKAITGRVSHALSGGLEYSYEDQSAPARIGMGTRGPVDIFHPNPNDAVVGYAPGYSGALTKGWTNTVALYAFDTVDLSRRLQLSGGLRWENYVTNFRNLDAARVTTVDQRASDALISGKAGLLFRMTERGNAYVSYGTSVTPPGAANFTLSAQDNNQNNPNVEPQKSRNYEVGTKWDFFRGRLLMNAAAFHTINENVLFTVDATAIPPIFNQDDEQRVDGFTVGGVGQIGERLQVIANYGYLDSRQNSQNPANDGKRLVLTPEHSFSFWTTYHFPFGLHLGAGLRFADSVFVNAANTIKVPNNRIADALVEYAVNDFVSLRLNVYNLTNETYVRSVNNNANRYNPGSPRSLMLTTAFHF